MSEYSKHPLMRYACDSCHGSGKWYDTHVHEDYAPLENTCHGCKGTGLDREKVKNALNIQATDKEIEQLQKAWQIINEANEWIKRLLGIKTRQDADLARLREALERLASMEALTMTRAVVMPHDEELIARINFAEQALKSHDSEDSE